MVQTKRTLAVEVSTLIEDETVPIFGLRGRLTISCAHPPILNTYGIELDDFMFSVGAAFVKVKYGIEAWKHPQDNRTRERGTIKVLSRDHDYATEVMCDRLGITRGQLANDLREAQAWRPGSFASVKNAVIHVRSITCNIPDKHPSVVLWAWVLPKKPTKV